MGDRFRGLSLILPAAVVPNANITITATDTGSVLKLVADSAGLYTDGPLNPGNYTVTVSKRYL